MRTVRLVERLAAVAGAMAMATVLFTGVGFAHGAAVQVTPGQAAAGATITVSGTGFEGGKEVSITLESALSQTSLGTATADQNESWTLMATVPASVAAGSYMVRATNAAAGGDDDTTGDLTVTAASVAQISQTSDQSAAQPAAQPALVHERTTAEDVIVGVTFGGLAIIGLILIFASRVHAAPGSSAGSKPQA